jgi:hypothetical protein
MNTAYTAYFDFGGTSATPLIPNSTWTHIAYVSTGYVFLNGVALSVTKGGTMGAIVNTTDLLNIGRHGWDATGYQYLNGYLDEIRISKGIARWKANFTPPLRPYFSQSI